MMRPRVLIADADEMLAAAYRAFLAGEGFEVQTVTNAIDCIESMRQSSPIALILDPDIPWGSGDGVLALMREGDDVPRLPVLILTSKLRLVTEAVLPFADYAIMQKPVSPATVVAIIRTLTDCQSMHDLFESASVG